jgi:serine/threonine-protein kinase
MSGSFRTLPTQPQQRIKVGASEGLAGSTGGPGLRSTSTAGGSRPGHQPALQRGSGGASVEPGAPVDDREVLARGSATMQMESVARLRCPHCHAAFRGNYTRCMRDGIPLVRTADDPLIGMTLAERYVIEALVGEGAMGLVYRAHHARLSRLFALKLMFGDVAADPSMRLRFAHEADAASRMSHPNVVSVLDFGKTENGLLYLAMEYAEGQTLAAMIRREGPLPEGRVVNLARQMARGLGHAHRAGLVHRDFKPANVAATRGEDGHELVRILDFGLAIAEGDGRIGRLTEHGLVVGTPIYISPEQARDQVVDHRADLFALGVVMYEMLAGKPPFEGTSHEIARANVTTTPPPIAQRNPAVRVSPELEALIMRLLAKRPADRPQSADDVIAALGQLGRRAVPLPVTDAAARSTRSNPRLPSPVRWLLARAANLGWRRPEAGGRRSVTGGQKAASWLEVGGAPPVATSAATVVDAAPFAPHAAPLAPHATSAATLIDQPMVAGAGAAVVWDAGRDGQATEGMDPAALRRAHGVVRQLMHRKSVVVAAWFALAASGVVCSMAEGKRSAADQSDSQIAVGTEVGGNGAAAEPRAPLALTWMHAVTDQIRCGVDSMGVRRARTAGGQFEGKMGPARARRCPTVQNAEPIEAERRWSRPARPAAIDRSHRSARPSPRRSSKDSAAQALPAMEPGSPNLPALR